MMEVPLNLRGFNLKSIYTYVIIIYITSSITEGTLIHEKNQKLRHNSLQGNSIANHFRSKGFNHESIFTMDSFSASNSLTLAIGS